MQSGDDEAGLQKAVRKPNRAKDVIVAVLLPWLIYVLVVSLFLFTYHDVAPIVWVLVVFCLALSLLFLSLGISVGLRVFLAIGLLCFGSTFVGTTVGLWLSDSYLERYYQLDTDVVKNVDPTVAPSPAAEETSVFLFKNDTFVDDMRTIGYVAGGEIYCVAPVSFPEQPDATVHYWAAGSNCCEMRRNFDCGISRSPYAYTAVVAEQSEFYGKAALMAQAVYGLRSSNTTRFVNFVTSAEEVKGDIWDEAVSITLASCILELLFCVAAGFMLWKVLGVPKPALGRFGM